MKVKDLIEELKKYDPEMTVISRESYAGSFGYNKLVVREGKHKRTKGYLCIEGE